MPIVYLNLLGLPASPTDRTRDVITASTLRVGAIATLSVTVKNTDPVAALCTVQFFTKHGAEKAKPIPTAVATPSNPPPGQNVGAGMTATFSINWDVQNVDLGANFVYAQIQPPALPDLVQDMTMIANAREPVTVLSAFAPSHDATPPA